MPQFVYKLMLVAATVIWGVSFVVMKDAVSVMEPAWLIGVRFSLTGMVLTVVFFKNIIEALSKPYFIMGAVLGVLLFLAFWIQTIGLANTTPGKNAFLTATYCVLVPFFAWGLTRKRPTIFNVIAAVMCVVGLGLVSLTPGSGLASIGFGDFMTIVCAIFFAIHIVYVSKYSEGNDIFALTVIQFWVGGACGIITGLCLETPPDWASLTPDFIFNLAYLVIFASCIALLFQNVGLAHVSPAQGSLLLSLESVFGVFFSVLLYGEELTSRLILGFVLIFAAIVVSEVFSLKPRDKEASS